MQNICKNHHEENKEDSHLKNKTKKLRASNIPIPANLEQLQDYLKAAIYLEHATIPLYLTTWSQIKGGAPDIKNVFLQEMNHMRIVWNILNAISSSSYQVSIDPNDDQFIFPNISNLKSVPLLPEWFMIKYQTSMREDLSITLGKPDLNHFKQFASLEYPDFGIEFSDFFSLFQDVQPGKSKTITIQDKNQIENTIGDFYGAIIKGIIHVNPAINSQAVYVPNPFTGSSDPPYSKLIQMITDIQLITAEGEGSPIGEGVPNEQSNSHFNTFLSYCLGIQITKTQYPKNDLLQITYQFGNSFSVEAFPINQFLFDSNMTTNYVKILTDLNSTFSTKGGTINALSMFAVAEVLRAGVAKQTILMVSKNLWPKKQN